MKYRLLDEDQLRRVLDAVVQLGAGRDALLIGVPPGLKSSLPVFRTRLETLSSDLAELNGMGALEDGSVPLRTWLRNALQSAGPRVEARTFREALAAVEAQAAPAGQARAPRFTDSQPAGQRRVDTVDRSDAPEVVVLHAPADDAFANALRTHVAVLKNTGKARFWFQGAADLGDAWEQELRARIDRAPIVLVLLSAAFLASETVPLVEQALAGGRRGIVPVVARPCNWQETRLGALTALPRNGRAISQHTSPDEAYALIAAELHELIRRLGSTAGGTGSRSVPPSVQPHPPPGQKLTVDEVFPASTPPGATYVMPAEHAEIARTLAIPDRGLVIEGPSMIGKSTAVTRTLEQLGRKFQNLLPGDPTIDALHRPEDVLGWIVVDDFHQLGEEAKKRIALLLKWMVDRPARDRKLVLLGVGEVTRTLLSLNTNLLGRVDTVRIKRQPDSRVAELLQKGEAGLNITFDPRDAIVSLANGSFALAQKLAAQAARDAGVVETESMTKQVDVSRVQLVEGMLEELRRLYSDPIADLLSRNRGEPRGVYLALLWLLAQPDDEGVRLTDVSNRYPQFIPVIDAVGEDALLAPLCGKDPLSECLRVDRRHVTVADPRFSFYLRNESFSRLARDGGLADVARLTDEGTLEFHGHDHEVRSKTAGAPMWMVHDADRFWPRRDVRDLLKLLSDAYGGSVQDLLQIASSAGIPAANVAFQGRAVADVARDIVERARLRGTIKPLLEALRADEAIGAWRSNLDEMLGQPAEAPAA